VSEYMQKLAKINEVFHDERASRREVLRAYAEYMRLTGFRYKTAIGSIDELIDQELDANPQRRYIGMKEDT
jgi:hypothetical protein